MSQSAATVLVDSSIYIFRAYFSLPENWHSPEGYPLNAVYGYSAFLLDFLNKLQQRGPVHLAAAFDESLGSCFRNDLYADYKSSRQLPDEALEFQLNACRELTEVLRIPCYSGSRFEADDYIATLAALGRKRESPVVVVSRDKDLGQVLLGEDDVLWDFAAGEQLRRADFLDCFGVSPEQFADYQGLVGDAVDDIPGVPGVGAKTAASLLQHYGSLDALSYRLDMLQETGVRGAKRIGDKLAEHWQSALMSRQLALLAIDIPGLELPGLYSLDGDALQAFLDTLTALGISGPVIRRGERMLSTVNES